jgi:hypothetical protein
MNADETRLALQAAITHLLVAFAATVQQESITDHTKRIDLGLEGEVAILNNGIVVYRPSGEDQTFSIDRYTAIFNPPYPPVQPPPNNTCPVCGGSGTIKL